MSSSDTQAFEIVTVASHRKDPSGGPGDLQVLVDSCRRAGQPATVLGLGEPWTGLTAKMRLLDRHLEDASEDRVVLFLDAFDTALLPGSRDIPARFRSFGKPIVFAAEVACWPDRRLRRAYPQPEPLVTRPEDHRIASLRPPPPRPSPFRYLNSGGYIGYAGAIREAIRHLAPGDHERDQRLYTRYFLEHPDRVALDHGATIFHTLFGVEPADFIFEEGAEVRLRSLLTDSRPGVLHGNGTGMKTFREIVARLRARGWP